jgi:septal ring-binding cell division protein DamX
MAAERRGAGLTFGQLITLTFGFLLASVVIFVFGLWVGRDLAEQQASKQRDVARVPVAAPPPEPTKPAIAAAPPAAAEPIAAVAAGATSTPMAAIVSTPVAVGRAAATPTRVRVAAATPTAGAGAWTVQAYATDDAVRAAMKARTLRLKGYDVTTATKQVGGATWYVLRVGHYRDRGSAKSMEAKLRSEEGLEAASVIAQ